MISAKEAREKSYNNNFFNKELQGIEKIIKEACKDGRYSVATNYIACDKAIDILKELGYKVTIDEGDIYYPPEMRISWDQ